MPRQRAAEPRDQQLLLRLTARQVEVLESIAHLERTTSNGYAHQLLVAHIAALEDNPRVRVDLENRAAYAQGAAKATPLRTKSHSRVNP